MNRSPYPNLLRDRLGQGTFVEEAVAGVTELARHVKVPRREETHVD